MKCLIVSLAASAVLLISGASFAGDGGAGKSPGGSDFALAAERHQSDVDLVTAPIRSEAQLSRFVSGDLSSTPLGALPPADREAFIRSLKFNDKGLTEFRFDVLSTLTPTQAHALLALFGQQRFTPTLSNLRVTSEEDKVLMATPMLEPPLTGYRCEERGTCVENASRACTSNC